MKINCSIKKFVVYLFISYIVHICTLKYTTMQRYLNLPVRTCMRTRAHTHTHTCSHAYIYIHINIIYSSISIHLLCPLSLSLFLYIYIYINISSCADCTASFNSLSHSLSPFLSSFIRPNRALLQADPLDCIGCPNRNAYKS